MNERAVIYFLVFIIWSQLSWRWYTTEIKGFYRADVQTSTFASRNMPENEEMGRGLSTKPPSFQMLQDGAILYFPYKGVTQTISKDVRNHLAELALRAIEENTFFEIIGHTDSKGSTFYNKQLGQERAEMVAGMLKEFGLKSEQLRVISKGEEELLFTDDEASKMSMNRRVEIFLKHSESEEGK